MKCPRCGKEADKVIYFGAPMKFCSDEECATLWGFWSWIPSMWFNGMFMEYKGHYLPALMYWLFGSQDE